MKTDERCFYILCGFFAVILQYYKYLDLADASGIYRQLRFIFQKKKHSGTYQPADMFYHADHWTDPECSL